MAPISHANALDPDHMTPADRLSELAEILAAGLMSTPLATVNSFISRQRRQFASLVAGQERSCSPA